MSPDESRKVESPRDPKSESKGVDRKVRAKVLTGKWEQSVRRKKW